MEGFWIHNQLFADSEYGLVSRYDPILVPRTELYALVLPPKSDAAIQIATAVNKKSGDHGVIFALRFVQSGLLKDWTSYHDLVLRGHSSFNALCEGLLAPEDEEQHQTHIVEGCPGCKCSHLQRSGAPFPRGMMLVVLTMSMLNALPIQILYPFLYFMVEDFHVDKRKIGTFAGLIASGYMVGRTATGFAWGYMADHHGRKPVIFCGMLSLIVFNALFGVSTSVWMAFITRFLLGAGNGLFAILAVYATEISSIEHRPFGLSTNTIVWGLGLIIGPSIGGFLSKPAEKYPGLFENTFFDRYPYLLPPLALSLFTFFLMFSLLHLPETRHNHIIASPNKSEKSNSIFRNYSFWISNVVYCLWAFHEISYNETFPLWAVSPGGLRWSSQTVGLVLAFTGVCLVFNMLFIFPMLINRYGPILVARTGTVLSLIVLVPYPFLPKLQGVACYVTVIIVIVIKTGLSAVTITALFILVNNSVEISQLGTANGISTSLVSLSRALGPSIGGFIFSCAQARPDTTFLPGKQCECLLASLRSLSTEFLTISIQNIYAAVALEGFECCSTSGRM
ncbi:hypothetical protein SELMODRAFT_431014 [Selaginella moellendorffii]|uniref:Major facilitator superfamily (MFS) profile domain-containing protein n=1 Tax=Selaginella moellendorffii TaxID=88036 RepID=D8TB90_SELML|nr:hypothetical protein SELMODRAFT_431014 [Selaginella moellendorffii]